MSLSLLYRESLFADDDEPDFWVERLAEGRGSFLRLGEGVLLEGELLPLEPGERFIDGEEGLLREGSLRPDGVAIVELDGFGVLSFDWPLPYFELKLSFRADEVPLLIFEV